MQFTKRLLMGLGGVALVAMLASMFVPKSVHALVATLVQVSNTPSNPVPNADVNKSAAQNIELFCADVAVNNFCSLQPQNGPQVAWNVPDGMNFVITDVDIVVQSIPGVSSGGPNATLRWDIGDIAFTRQESWFVPNSNTTTQFHYSSGIVVIAQSSLVMSFFIIPNGGNSFAILHGYLTPN
jgi:hypothetical protein